MKQTAVNYLLALGLLIASSIVSCSKDKEPLTGESHSKHYPSSQVDQPEVILLNGDSTLRFKNEAHLRSFLASLTPSTSILSKSFYSSYQDVDSSIQQGIEENYEIYLSSDYLKTKEKGALFALFNDQSNDGAYDPYPICRAKS